MSRKESFVGDDDDDYWQYSKVLANFKLRPFDLDDNDTADEEPWTTDSDGFERLSTVASYQSQTFSASSVSERFSGSARYRTESSVATSHSRSVLDDYDEATDTSSVDILGIAHKDLQDSVEPVSTSLEQDAAGGSGAAARLSPEATVKQMILGKPYQFEWFKSKEEKLALLDASIHSGDGNTIMATVLFLKSSLKRSMFHKALQTRPAALNHFLCYLRAHYDFMELEDTLSMFQKAEDAAILKYSLAASKSKTLDKVRALQACYRTHFEYEPILVHDGELVKQHVSLLERQLPIEDADAAAIAQDSSISLRYRPRSVPTVIGLPLMSTVQYCSLYHFPETPNILTSPHGIRDEYKLDARQFLWCAVTARAKFHDFAAIENLLTAKNWYGGKKMKSVIGFDKVVEILEEAASPNDVLSKYLKLIDDEDVRFNLANKYKCYQVAVDTLISMKDRQQLESYVAKVLPAGSEDYRYAQNALNISNVKWKN